MAMDNDQPDLLVRLTRTNPTIVVLATVGVFLGILLLPDLIGAVLIAVIAAGLGWLLTKTWPVLPSPARALRLLVLALLIAVAGVKLFL